MHVSYQNPHMSQPQNTLSWELAVAGGRSWVVSAVTWWKFHICCLGPTAPAPPRRDPHTSLTASRATGRSIRASLAELGKPWVAERRHRRFSLSIFSGLSLTSFFSRGKGNSSHLNPSWLFLAYSEPTTSLFFIYLQKMSNLFKEVLNSTWYSEHLFASSLLLAMPDMVNSGYPSYFLHCLWFSIRNSNSLLILYIVVL